MADDEDRVTTLCPRCGKPIVWSVQPFDDGEQLEVSGGGVSHTGAGAVSRQRVSTVSTLV